MKKMLYFKVEKESFKKSIESTSMKPKNVHVLLIALYHTTVGKLCADPSTETILRISDISRPNNRFANFSLTVRGHFDIYEFILVKCIREAIRSVDFIGQHPLLYSPPPKASDGSKGWSRLH